VKYELLDPDEWPRLIELVDPLTFPIPPPHSASAVVARDDSDHGQLAGALFLQPQLHMEPLIISQKYSGYVNFSRMVRLFESHLEGREYYVFAPDEKIARMAELVGLTRLPWMVYHKELKGE
jgi:hypothetical protein